MNKIIYLVLCSWICQGLTAVELNFPADCVVNRTGSLAAEMEIEGYHIEMQFKTVDKMSLESGSTMDTLKYSLLDIHSNV